LWEEKHPEVAQSLWALTQAHSQQDQTSQILFVVHSLDCGRSFNAVGLACTLYIYGGLYFFGQGSQKFID
jgi:hypothetical protein